MELLSKTFELVGTLLIAFAALRVHHRVLNAHHITKEVMYTMRIEQRIGIIGVFFLVAGYVLSFFI